MTPAGQRWTRNKPTEPGWYWWRTVNGDSAVRIIHTHEGGLLIQFEGGHVTHLHRVTLGEWQGPLTPNEATE
jgi:hypothetical protein